MDQGLIDADAMYNRLINAAEIDQRLINAVVVDQRLMNAAREGNIDALYALLLENPFVLENLDRFPFIDTPLHVALLAGKTSFAMEIAHLKPSFANKLNQDGYSPMHLASAKGDMGMVKELLTINGRELSLLKGREKRTPLHVAVMFGRTDVINELVHKLPKSLDELTVHKETVLHLALKNEQLVAFNLLLEWVKELNKRYMVNLKDNEGNTVLHLATPIVPPKMVEDLLHIYDLRVEVNAINASNQTALDVLLQLPIGSQNHEEIKGILGRAKAVRGNQILFTSPPRNSADSPVVANIPSPLKGWLARFRRKVVRDYSMEVRSALLVVAVLTATQIFQTGVNPPGGVWQGDSYQDYNKHTNATTVTPSAAGKAIMATNHHQFVGFTLCNLSGFLISYILITILTDGFPFSRLLHLAMSFMGITYMFSLLTITPADNGSVLFFIPQLLLATPMISLLYHGVKYFQRKRHQWWNEHEFFRW